MKIGILTHHYVKNFGAFMQAKALIETIKTINPDAKVELIDLRVPKHAFKNYIHFLVYKPHRDTIKSLFEKIKLFCTHYKYEKTLPQSKKIKVSDDLNALNYDLIIVGSDEVWNFTDIAYSPLKFGEGIEKSVLISYAASVGGANVNDIAMYKSLKCLDNFAAISVRDSMSSKLVEKLLGDKPVMVLDPVYLYDYQVEICLKVEQLAKKPYILIYDCRLGEDKIKEIKRFASENNLRILGAGEYRKWYSDYSTNLSPFEWLYLFKNAKFIITGTFHGTSFSIKYNKQFIVYLTAENRIQKVGSLLKGFNLEQRIISNTHTAEHLVYILADEINYVPVNDIIDEKICESINYLKKYVGRRNNFDQENIVCKKFTS